MDGGRKAGQTPFHPRAYGVNMCVSVSLISTLHIHLFFNLCIVLVPRTDGSSMHVVKYIHIRI